MPDITMPNGDVVSFPDDMPKEQIRSLIASKFPQETQQPVQEQQRTWGEYLSSIPQQYAQGGTFGFGDEAMAALAATYATAREQPSALFGAEMNPELAQQVARAPQMMREELKQQQQAYPITSGLSQVGGMIATGAGAAKAFPAVASGISKLPWWASAPAVGAPSFAAYEAGQSEGDRGQAFVGALPEGAAYGYLGGAAGKYAPAVMRGLGGLSKRAASAFSKQPVAKTLDEVIEKQSVTAPVADVPRAYEKVAKAVRKDLGADLDTAMEAYKKGDISLSDLYGKRTTSLAEASALFTGGREVAEQAIDPKVMGSYDRVLNSIRKNISGVDSYYSTADDLLAAGRAKAAPLYEKAYNDKIKDTSVLTMPEVQGALDKAFKTYQTRLKDIAPDSIEALDYAKKILDDDISKARRAGENNLAGAITDVKNRLVSVMDDASPSYKEARKAAGDYLSVDSAMNAGKKALKKDYELVTDEFKNLTSVEKDAYKIGLGKAIRDQLNTVREGANPFNKILKSPEQQKRLKAVLSPQEYFDFEKSLRAEDKLFQFRNKVLGGSPTAMREEAKQLIESGAIDTITGVPKNTFRDVITKMGTRITQGINDKTAAKISDILYETDPVKKLKIIESIQGDKALTKLEKQAIQRGYSFMSPRYDALYTTTGAASATPAMQLRGNE